MKKFLNEQSHKEAVAELRRDREGVAQFFWRLVYLKKIVIFYNVFMIILLF
jgi:hypothetical protein